MTKKAWLILALCMVFMISACSGATDNAAESNNDQTAVTPAEGAATETKAPEEGSLDKKIEIAFLAGGFQNAVEGDWIELSLEEKFNIDLVDKKINVHDQQQQDLMLASGEMPDFASSLGKAPTDMYDQGITRTIPKALIEKYAPNYAKEILSSPIASRMHLLAGSTDEYIALTGLFGNESIYFFSNYRLDWLENLGIEPNGNLKQIDAEGRIWLTDQPFTQAQHFEIMKKFRDEDPDQNGQKDTYGLTAVSEMGFDNFSWAPIMGMFGIGFQYFGEQYSNLEENGQTILFSVSTRYKQFLKYMNALYEAGTLDPEFVTTDFGRFREKLTQNIGYHSNLYYYFNPGNIAGGPYGILNNNPAAKILVAPPELGESGDAGTSVASWNPFQYTFFIGKDVDDEKLIRILQLFDYMFFDKEARVWSRFGEEGVNWKWEGEPYKSQVIQNLQGEPLVSPYNDGSITLKEDNMFTMHPVMSSIFEYAGGAWLKDYGIYPHRTDPFNETRYTELFTQYGAGLQTLRMEFTYNVITGKVDVDAEWDNYIQRMNDAGMDELTVELNKQPLVTELLGR